MKKWKKATKSLGVWLVVLCFLVLTVTPGYALDERKVNKLINSVQKKYTATVEARDALYQALRTYERSNSGAIGLVERWVDLVDKTSDVKKQKKFWNSALKQCKNGYKEINKLNSAWEKKSKALWKELKNLDQALAE